jgi:hypothetical protein
MEKFKTRGQSALKSDITDIQTTLEVNSATSFPTTGNFRIRVDNEIMLVTGVASAVFTVTRGAESTVGAAHTIGATVSHVLTAGALDTHYQIDMCPSAVIASKPAAVPSGGWFFPTDANRIFHGYTGSLMGMAGVRPMTPPIGIFDTWLNQNDATADESKGYLRLSSPYNAFQGLQARLVACAGGAETHEVCYMPDAFTNPGTSLWGMIWYRAASDDSVCMCSQVGTSYATVFQYCYQNTNSSSASMTTISNTHSFDSFWQNNHHWVKGVFDGTEFSFYTSNDGWNWLVNGTALDAATLIGGAPTHVGVFIRRGGTLGFGASFIHWS